LHGRTIRHSDLDVPQLALPLGLFQAVETGWSATPDRLIVALEQHGHCGGSTVRSVRDDAGKLPCKIEAKQAGAGCHPVLAAACFQKIGDRRWRKTLLDAEVHEPITV